MGLGCLYMKGLFVNIRNLALPRTRIIRTISLFQYKTLLYIDKGKLSSGLWVRINLGNCYFDLRTSIEVVNCTKFMSFIFIPHKNPS